MFRFRFRRSTLSKLAPAEELSLGGILILPADGIENRTTTPLSENLKDLNCALHCFGQSSLKLHKQNKQFSTALTTFKKPLTEKQNEELDVLDRMSSSAQTKRCQPRDTLQLDVLFEGAVTLKRHHLYLATQISQVLAEN